MSDIDLRAVQDAARRGAEAGVDVAIGTAPKDGVGKPIESGEPVTRKPWDISAKLRNGAIGAAVAGIFTEVAGLDRMVIWLWNAAIGSWSGIIMPDEVATTVITIIAYFAAGWFTRDNAPVAGPKPAT
jgi:hypothetical protein